MKSRDVIDGLRRFDAYPKTLEDFRIKTFGGATVTLVAAILMIILFLSELNYYLQTDVQSELFVDTARGQKLRINVDIVFPKLGCAFVSVDAMDVSGEQQIDVDHNILKDRLDSSGAPIKTAPVKQELGGTNNTGTAAASKQPPLDPNRCESCYGAEGPKIRCCNTCNDVREAYRQKGWAFTKSENIEQCKREGWNDHLEEQQNEGCRLYGHLEVNKVAGNFHFAPGKSFSQHHVHVHDLQAFAGRKFNLSHHIRHLSFGKNYPGMIDPLQEAHQNSDESQVMFQYFIKVVPTTYAKVNGDILYTNQYSVTKHQKRVGLGLGDSGLPGIFFMSFMHFLTGVCAIIGGVFTVASLIDSLIYHSARVIQKKMELGKFS